MMLKSKIKMMHGWAVAWCDQCPVNECGDADLDRASYIGKEFSTLKEAKRYAAEIMATKRPFFGCVQIDEFQWNTCDFAPWLAEIEYIGETIEIS